METEFLKFWSLKKLDFSLDRKKNMVGLRWPSYCQVIAWLMSPARATPSRPGRASGPQIKLQIGVILSNQRDGLHTTIRGRNRFYKMYKKSHGQ